MTARRLICFIILSMLGSGCVLAPGMQTLDLQRSSASSGSVDGPVVDADGNAVPAGIQHITPALIRRLNPNANVSSNPSHGMPNPLQSPTGQYFDSDVDRARFNGVQITDDYVYRVGSADILSIIVWEHPELTIPAGAERTAEQAGTVVESDGTIYYPYAGVVHVAGKTIPEIRTLLTQKLNRYIQDVKLDVRMAQYNHKRVYVVGEVKQPRVVAINNIQPTVIEMVNASGGFTENADSQTLTLTRDGETYRVDLLALYEKGDASQNVVLQSGDVVNVWDRAGTKVYVLGEVIQPGSYYVNKGRKSLAEAMSDAGGVNPNTSNPSQVFVFRQNKDQAAEVFHLDASSPDALLLADQFALQARDVVYVEAADIVRWSRVIQNISGTVGTLNQASQTDFPLFKGAR